MFLLGLLSFFQIVFIPGFVLINIFKVYTSTKIERVLISFSLSLVTNYLLVFLLVSLNIYYSWVIYFILTLEILYLVSLFINNYKGKIGISINNFPQKIFKRWQNGNLINNIAELISAVIIIIYISYFLTNLGTVYKICDAVVSWNIWAQDWANNKMAVQTYLYPQLIPANVSISYVIMQNTQLQFFAKAIMPLFSLGLLLMFLDLYIKKKEPLYIFGLFFIGILMRYFFHPDFIGDGYVDIPLSFMAFFVFYMTLNYDSSRFELKKIILIALFASAVPITKQMGFFVLGITYLWIIYHIYQKRTKESKPYFTILALILLALTVTSWYYVKLFEIINGTDNSNLLTIAVDAHGGRGILERFIFTYNSLFVDKGIFSIFLYIVLLLIIVSLYNKKNLLIFISTVVYTGLFCVFLSYEPRNLSMAFPFYAYLAGSGLVVLIRRIKKNTCYNTSTFSEKAKKIGLILSGLLVTLGGILYFSDSINGKIITFASKATAKVPGPHWLGMITTFEIRTILCGLILLAFLLIASYNKQNYIIHKKTLFIIIALILLTANVYYSPEKLFQRQFEMQKMIGDPRINKRFFDYLDTYGLEGKIATNNSIMKYISEINKYFYICSLEQENDLLGIENDKTVMYIFYHETWLNEKMHGIINAKIKEKRYQLIFLDAGYYFIKLR